ncbi:MAG TPA: hypothetical protein VFP36_12775 [Usitatibacter sp.]|nr:hypothetical protein [Usitatibacter sp.]
MNSKPARRAAAVIASLAIAVGALWWLRPSPANDADRAQRQPAASVARKTALPSGVAVDAPGKRVETIVTAREPRPLVLPLRPDEPLPPPGTPVKAMFESLKALADQGDARAACRLAFELDRCRKIDILRSLAFPSREAAKNSLVRMSEDEIARRAAEWQKRFAQAESACKDVSDEEALTAWDYGLAAALAGNREARWLVAFFPVGLDYDHPENTLEGWAEWRRYIPRILQEGVDAGDARMFSLASRAYLVPTLGYQVYPHDNVRAAALAMAVAPRAADPYRATADRNVAYLVDRYHLGDEEQRRARALAATLPPLTQVPAGGIDWSRGMSPDADGTGCEKP